MTWRESIAPKVAKVLADAKDVDDKTRRRMLRDAYPYGERKRHPYKIWCDEIRRQTGKRKKKLVLDPNQLNLFS